MRVRGLTSGAFACILSFGLAVPISASQTVPATQAHNRVGENATVCGIVASTHYVATGRGRPTFINLDKAYPNQVFTVVIWGSDRAKFGRPEDEYQGKDICVTGKITEYRGTPEIVAASPGQIRTREKHKSK
jgi:DNA/RNA endonuclease YhcR with UshA esterase domain